jgi:hypothetical protein
MISLDDVALLLRGWRENESRLRVVVQSPVFSFSGLCTLFKAEGESLGFWVGDFATRENALSFSVAECAFDFGDVSADAPDAVIPLGDRVLSGIVGSRRDFKIAIMLLADKPSKL